MAEMTPPWLPPQDQAQTLADRGILNPALLQRMYPSEPPAVAAGPSPIAAQPVPMPNVAQPAASERDFIDDMAETVAAKKQEKVASKEAAQAELARKNFEFNQNVLKNQISADIEDGMTPDEVRKKYQKPLAALEEQKSTLPTMPSVQKTSAPDGPTPALAADGGAVTLAADMPAQQFQPQNGSFGMESFAPDETGYNMQQKAFRDIARVGAAKAVEESAYLDQTARENERRMAEAEERDLQRKERLDSEFAKVDEQIQKYASMSVDPNKYWADKTTGDKVMAGIGLFLGAFGQGGNKAVPVIQNAIDQDIAAQKANIAKEGDTAQMRKGLYHDMMARFKDDRLADAATRMAYLDNAQLRVQQIASKYQAPELRAKAEQLVGDLEQKKQDARAAFSMQVMKMMPQAGEVANPELYVPGYGMALTKDDAKDLKKAAATKESFDRQLQEMIDLRKKFGGESSNREAVERGKQLSNSLLLAYKNMAQLGVLSKSDEDIINSIIPSDPLAFRFLPGKDPILSRLEKFKGDVQKDFTSQLKYRMPSYQPTEERVGFKPIASK